MIVKLEEKHRKQVLDFVSSEPEINLFFIGDIENYGFDNQIQDVWASFDSFNKIEAVLLRYKVNFIPYFKDLSFDINPFVEIINSFKGERFISGKEIITSIFEQKIKIKKSKKSFFCALNNSTKLENEINYKIRKAKVTDCERIALFLDTIPEFVGQHDRKKALQDKVRKKAGRIYFIETEEGEVLSTVSSDAENPLSAMIMGVATKTGYRNKGRTSQCLSVMCRELISEGKSLCLFYDNPAAGKIYKRLGFKDLDKWTMLFL